MAGDNIGELRIVLSFDDKQFSTGIKAAEKASSQSAQKVETTWQKVGQAIITDLAVKAFGAVTNAAKKIGSSMIEVGMNFESSMSEVAAITGATGDDLALLEKTAKDFGSSTVFSASEAADALKYMGLAGWDAQQSSKALGGVLDLAAASGMELAAASDMVTDYLSAFGMEAEQSAYFADLLTYAQNNSNTTAMALGEAYKNCAANLNAAGQDVETTTSLLAMMANQGLKGSEAGTALNAVMRDMTSKMKNGAIAIGNTSVQIMDANGNYRDMTDILRDVESATNGMGDAEKAAALSSSFTADSIKGLNLIMNAGVDEAAKFEEELRKSGGAAADTAAIMNDNLAGKVKALQSKVEDLLIKGFEKMEPVLDGVIRALEWCADHADILIPVLGTLAGVITTTFVATKVIEFGNKVKKVFGTTSKAAKKVSDGLSKTFKDGIGNQVATEAGKSVEKVSKSMTEKITSLGSTLQTAFKTIGDVLSSVVGAVMEPIKTLLKGVGEAIAGFFTALADPMIAVGAAMFTVAAAAIAAAILMVGAAIGVTMPTWEALFNNIIMPTAEFIASTVLALIDNLTNNIIRLTNEALIPLGNFVVGSFLAIVNQITDAIIRFTQQAVIPLVTTLSGALMNILRTVSDFLNTTLKTAFDGIKGIVDSVGDAFKKMGDVVVGALNSVNGILSTFKDLLLGIADAIVAVVALATGHSINYGRGFAHISKAATGGRVGGVGTATSDSNLFALSKGEYVIKASSAKRIGYDALDQLNAHGEISAESETSNWSGLLAAALAEEFEMGEIATSGERPIENTQNIIVNDKMDIRKVGNAFLQEIRRVA